MKLNELKQLNETPTDHQHIVDMMELLGLDEDYSIRADGAINTSIGVNAVKEIIQDGKLTVKFGTVDGNFNCMQLGLTSFEGCPDSVIGIFHGSNNDITSLEGCPAYTQQLFNICLCPKLISFVGINDHIKYAKEIFFSFKTITKGGIGLLLIEGLKKFTNDGYTDEGPWTIINSYMDKKDDIFECQMELIEAGFEEYAQL